MRFELTGASYVMKSMTRIGDSKSVSAVSEGHEYGSPAEHCGQRKERRLESRPGKDDGDLAGWVRN